MTGFTPEPWDIRFDVNVFAGDRLVAACGGYATNADSGEHVLENKANARLVRAAPLLLAACKMALAAANDEDAPWWMDCPSHGGLDVEMLETAIALAEPKEKP